MQGVAEDANTLFFVGKRFFYGIDTTCDIIYEEKLHLIGWFGGKNEYGYVDDFSIGRSWCWYVGNWCDSCGNS